MNGLIVLAAICILCVFISITFAIYEHLCLDEHIVSSDYNPSTQILTVICDTKCGKKGIKNMYVGSGTVWHTYPEFDRCGTNMEYRLSELYRKWKYNNGRA